jgi:hypothetical protein
LLKEIGELKEKLRDRQAALPAHSVRPYQLQEIEEIEERIAELEKLLGETN